MNYQKFKRNIQDICNICKKKSQLSWDHIPPKGGVELLPMEIEGIYKILMNKQNEGERQFVITQNGVKYRTICKECNSLLGTRYDPVLNEFSISLSKLLKSNLYLPCPIIKIKTRPNAIIRGILGHLLAAKIEFFESPFDEKIRLFLADEKSLLPDDISIFYWLYPYNQTVIFRDFSMPAIRGIYNEWGFFNVIKYFPLAYIITNLKSYDSLPELSYYREFDLTMEIEMKIDLRNIRKRDWPEHVGPNDVILLGKDGLDSIRAKPRKI
ncbi:MAG: hypothetical protein QY316_06420 [Thermodesulfobacteriota bacterium]|nr:MAG: hypothetical protein QY316_06420 [Thermodesulfobacteriota bacterium]